MRPASVQWGPRSRAPPGTLYGALARLERRGWVRPLATAERRRPYEITAAGQEILAEQVTTMQQIVHQLRHTQRPHHRRPRRQGPPADPGPQRPHRGRWLAQTATRSTMDAALTCAGHLRRSGILLLPTQRAAALSAPNWRLGAPKVRCPPGRRSPESPEDSQVRCGDAIDAQPDQLIEARAVIDRPRQNQQFVPVHPSN